ncbi:MAG: type II secretion system F family protein [Methylocystis sp.]
MEDNLTLFAVASVAVAAVLLLVFFSLSARGGKARRRMAALGPQKDRTENRARSVDPAKRRKAVAESLKEFETEKEKKKVTIEQRIAQAGLRFDRRTFFILSGGIGAFLAFALFVLNGDPLVSLGGAFVGVFGLPLWFLSFLRKRRVNRFIDEFPGAIDVIVRGVRAGLPVADCFRIVANEAHEPVKSEFRQIVEAQAIGLTVGEAVERLAERLPIPEASFFAIVISITQNTGGNLSESLSNLSTVLRDRKKMRGKIKAMSTEAKVSAGIIGSLPFVVCLALYFLQPNYLMTLFTMNGGKIVVGGSLTWMMFGVLIMRKMIDFDF